MRSRRALVTGGTSGLGRAIAYGLAEEGADVVVCGRQLGLETERVLLTSGVRAKAISADVSREAEVVRLVREAEEFLGAVDLFVNVAGGTWHEPIAWLTAEAWQSTFATNAAACAWACREVARGMIARRSGSILVVGSTTLSTPAPGESAYRASKAALKAFAEVAALELAAFGVRVNILTPGPFDTPFVRGGRADLRSRIAKCVPLGRREGRADEIVGAALLLLSDKLSPYTTGAELIVDGGLSLSSPTIYGDEEIRAFASPPTDGS